MLVILRLNRIYSDTKEYLTEDSLDLLNERLDSSKFMRVHRSSIINFDFLKELKRLGDRKYLAVLSDHYQTEVLISRDKLAEVKKYWESFTNSLKSARLDYWIIIYYIKSTNSKKRLNNI